MAITRSQIARQLLAEGGAPRQGFQMGSNVDEFRQPVMYDQFGKPVYYEDFTSDDVSDSPSDRSLLDRGRDFLGSNRQGILGSVLGSAIFGLPGAILGGFLGRRRDQGGGIFESARDRDARIAQQTIEQNRRERLEREMADRLAGQDFARVDTSDSGMYSGGPDASGGQTVSASDFGGDFGQVASGGPAYDFKDGGDVSVKDAEKMAPPGESLAYINDDEAALLKSLGGAGKAVNQTGIPSYFIKKVFRKAKKAVKKIVKSPLGKAAITGAALFGIPGTPFKGFGKSLPFELPSFLEGNTGKAIAGIVGASALAGMTAPKEEEQESLSQRIADRTGLDIAAIRKEVQDAYAAGDISGLRNKYPFLPPVRATAAEGGMMDLGGNEMDLRGGGFVPIGKKEKADDVPARLSKNEFVFTADAVRAAGGGSVDRGADLMYKTMKQLENKVA